MTTDPAATKSTDRPKPPYIAASTFMTTIEGWRAVRPSRVERGVLNKVAGSVQTWLIAALRYFDLIDAAGVPTPKLDELATATTEARPKLIADMLRTGYPFLFTNGVDLSNITQADMKKKFEATGAQGETAVKAMSFFTAMAKEAGIKLSPYVLTRQRRSNGSKRAAKTKTPPTPATASTANIHTPTTTPPAMTMTLTPMQVLIDMLSVDGMTNDEQAAVWTLIKFLKKGAK